LAADGRLTEFEPYSYRAATEEAATEEYGDPDCLVSFDPICKQQKQKGPGIAAGA
jgi:hypothetical protein